MTTDPKKLYQDAVKRLDNAEKSWEAINNLIGGTSKDEKYEEAGTLFSRAGAAFKGANNFHEAANAYQKAASCYQKTKYNERSWYKNIMEACTCLLKYDQAAGVKLLASVPNQITDDTKAYEVTRQLAEEYEKMGKLLEALHVYSEIIKTPASKNRQSDRVKLMVRMADINIKLEQYDGAIDVLNQILAVDVIYIRSEQLNYIMAVIILHMCLSDFIGVRKTADRYRSLIGRDCYECICRLAAAGLNNDSPTFSRIIDSWDTERKPLMAKCLEIADKRLHERYLNDDFS